MCPKRRFTEKEAKVILKKIEKSHKQYRKECRYYYCKVCNAYHLTSMEEFELEEPQEIKLKFKKKWKKILKK